MSQWQQLSERFNQLQRREKLMIWGGSLVLTGWLLLIYLLEPGWQKLQHASLQAQQLQRQHQDAEQLAAQLREQLTADMDKDYRSRIEQLHNQQQQLNSQIRQSANNFIGAEQMVSLLQSVLQRSSTVQIIRLQTAEPVPVRLQGQLADEPALLFEHQLTLAMAGNYGTLQQVLQQLEQLPWLVNWAGLEYQVTDYPMAQMTIQLGTVSENEDFIRL
jgi:MSHA biogenesis protein MshJ